MDVTPLELVAAYAPFANGGTARAAAARDAHRGAGRHACSGARRSRRDAGDGSARRVSDHVDAARRRGLRHRHARSATWASPVRSPARPGTTNNGDDVWFVGYTPTLVAGVWFGYDTPRQIAPQRVGRSSRRAGVGGVLSGGLARTERIGVHGAARNGSGRSSIRRRVSWRREWCPSRAKQWFKPGREPQETCHMHTGPPQGQIAIGAERQRPGSAQRSDRRDRSRDWEYSAEDHSLVGAAVRIATMPASHGGDELYIHAGQPTGLNG